MGMYTKFNLNIRIKNNRECIDILKYMLHYKEEKPFIPDDDLFKTRRWERMLNSCSDCFTGDSNSQLHCYYKESYSVLHCDCDLKNYDSEIELFLKWISKYIGNCYYDEFVGYYICEENDIPTLIYANEQGIYTKEIEKLFEEE